MKTLSRRNFLRAAAGAIPMRSAWSAQRPAGARPNVVVILADDQGWGDLSIHGNTNLSPPHIDSLAHDGALFERFYVCGVRADKGGVPYQQVSLERRRARRIDRRRAAEPG